MVHVVFEYLYKQKWVRTECEFPSMNEFRMSFCSLIGFPVEWKIISVEEI